MISGISLFDILQVLSMSRSSKVIEVQHAAGNGVIYVENGNIVHAKSDDKSGEEVVYDCLSEEVIGFKELPWRPVEVRTVNRTTSYLLLESARLKDEKGSVKIKADVGGRNEETAERGERQHLGKKAEALVQRTREIPFVTGVIMTWRNGEVLAASGDNINSLRILISMMIGVGGQIREALQSERLDMITVNLVDDKKVLIMDLKSAYISVLIQKEGVLDLIKNGIIGILKNEK